MEKVENLKVRIEELSNLIRQLFKITVLSYFFYFLFLLYIADNDVVTTIAFVFVVLGILLVIKLAVDRRWLIYLLGWLYKDIVHDMILEYWMPNIYSSVIFDINRGKIRDKENQKYVELYHQDMKKVKGRFLGALIDKSIAQSLVCDVLFLNEFTANHILKGYR